MPPNEDHSLFGTSSKYALPKIKATSAGKFQRQWEAMIKQIESSSGAQKMMTVEEAKKAAKK